MIFLNQASHYPGRLAPVPTVGTALMIASGPYSLLSRYLLSSRAAVSVGLISYPLYLWHWPLLSFARIMTVGEPTALVRCVSVCMAVALAWATYAMIERPLRHQSGLKVALPLAAGMIVIGLAGIWTWHHGGQTLGKPLDSITLMYRNYPHGPEHDANCDGLYPQFSDFHRCRLSARKAPDTAIIGDSHSGQYFNSMAKLLDGHTIINIDYQACLPFSTYDMYPDCTRRQKLTYTFLENTTSIKTVMVAGYWYHLIVGGYQKDLAGGSGVLRPLDPIAARRFVDLGANFINALIRAGKRVVFVYDNPDLPFDPRSCLLYRPLSFLERVREDCSFSQDAFKARSAPYDAIIAQLTARFPGITYFDPRQPLCDRERCHAMRGGRLLYWDATHLSAAGADLVVRSMRHALFQDAKDKLRDAIRSR
jgi:hypothetical protein